MKIRMTLILFIMSTVVYAQKAPSMSWLVGVWKITTDRGTIVERWIQLNDSTLNGINYFVKAAGDSSLQETLELSYRKGQWVYSSRVKGQNNNQTISFTVTFVRGTEFISENPAHDFPQRIAYRRIKNNLFASIEGKRNGRLGKQNFDFVLE
ncbi:MAG: hypothetical protein KF846_13805 [Cyclobacteriaceae bacterium]|nr:hypothetical protein [Cyclobacteriaceae bacterium]MBX2957233.1 hypothetical protein [Cyclobacteriaceae bacterium]